MLRAAPVTSADLPASGSRVVVLICSLVTERRATSLDAPSRRSGRIPPFVGLIGTENATPATYVGATITVVSAKDGSMLFRCSDEDYIEGARSEERRVGKE